MTETGDSGPKGQPGELAGTLDAGCLRGFLQTMLLIRAFDTTLPTLYAKGLVRGSTHAAIGQEAVATGACAALNADDYITSTHRGHGHAIAKGANITRMMAELLGRSDGYCRGKGGSMHIADFSHGMLGANGIVGGGFGLATGAALTASLSGTDQVALCFFGDGALNQGSFLECTNMAAIWKLPVIYLCENNHFAMSAQPEKMIGVADLTDRARGVGLPSESVDGMDVAAVYEATSRAVLRARSGEGPQFLLADCYRFEGHFSGDTLSYRSASELTSWTERDPIQRLAGQLVSEGGLTAEDYTELQSAATKCVSDALAEAEKSPFPDSSEVWEDLFV